MIGYQYVIRRDNRLETGRPRYLRGAHVRGFNDKSIGICAVGREVFTEGQIWVLRQLLDHLTQRKYPEDKIVGHTELYSNKTFPNSQIMDFIRSYRGY